jgi:hypothetical protein
MSLIFLIHVIVTILLAAIYWYLQIVHFPLLRFIQKENNKEFINEFKMKNTLMFFPLKSLEVFSSIALLLSFAMQPDMTSTIEKQFYIIGFNLLIISILYMLHFQKVRSAIYNITSYSNDAELKKILQWQWVITIGTTIRTILIVSLMLQVA